LIANLNWKPKAFYFLNPEAGAYGFITTQPEHFLIAEFTMDFIIYLYYWAKFCK